MLPPQHRLRSSRLFATAVKKGQKKGSRTVVLHLYDLSSDNSHKYMVGDSFSCLHHEELYGGPRIGLVVSKAVGNAVQRHHVSRRLRNIAASFLQDSNLQLNNDTVIIIRALPQASSATWKELYSDVLSCLHRLC